MADAVEAALGLCPWLTVDRVGDNVVARTDLGRRRRVLLAGHLDTVPPAGGQRRAPGRGRPPCTGSGAADMKGGLAVFLHLAGQPPGAGGGRHLVLLRGRGGGPGVQRTAVSCGRSGPTCWPPTPPSWASRPAGVVEAGCQGTLRVRIRLAGQRAHTARPHTGRNAVHRLAPVLDRHRRVRRCAGRSSTGASTPNSCRRCRWRAAWPATWCRTGPPWWSTTGSPPTGRRSRPSRRCGSCSAPTSSPATTGSSSTSPPGAPPSLDHPVLAALVAATGAAAPGQGGLDRRGRSGPHGVPAANFGPGRPAALPHPGRARDGEELRAAAVPDRCSPYGVRLRRSAEGDVMRHGTAVGRVGV